jgi:group I intron endonuclease
MSSIYSIYKITNTINGKLYIGFDSNWPNRQKSHKYQSNKRNQKIYHAIRKCGWNNFIWEVIYQSKDGKHCLSVMEPFFIKEYNSFENGYNLTLGGEGTLGRPTTNLTKSKISKALKNKPKTKEHLQKMSETRKGKTPSVEALKKRSESMKRTLKLKKDLLQSKLL